MSRQLLDRSRWRTTHREVRAERVAKDMDPVVQDMVLLQAGVIKLISETPGPQMTVIVGMPGKPAMIPPSQEEIDAAAARRLARYAGKTIDAVAQGAGKTIAVEAQPPVARLSAPSAKPDTPSD